MDLQEKYAEGEASDQDFDDLLYEIVRDATDEQLAIHESNQNRGEALTYLFYFMFGMIVVAGGMMYYMLATCKSGQKPKPK